MCEVCGVSVCVCVGKCVSLRPYYPSPVEVHFLNFRVHPFTGGRGTLKVW